MSNILRNLKGTLNYKNLLFLICVLGLTLQTIELFDDFMEGKTLPNLFLGKIDNDNFPAITICPSYIDFGKIAKLNKIVSTDLQKIGPNDLNLILMSFNL